MKNYQRIFNILFLLFLAYLPFQLALNIAADIDLASIRILIIGFFLFWLGGRIIIKGKIINLDFFGFGLVAFLFFNALSLLFAGEANWGWRKILFLASIFPLYFVVADLAADPERRKKIINILTGAAAVSALGACGQFLAQFIVSGPGLVQVYTQKIGPLFWGRSFSSLIQNNQSWFVESAGGSLMRAFGLFPDPHMLAFFLGLIAPVVLARLLFYPKAGKYHFFFILLALAIFLSFSRGGYLALLVSGSAVVFLSWPNLFQRKKQLIVGACALGIFLVFIFGQPLIVRFASSFLLSDGSSIGRLEIWRESLDVFLARPVFGVGLGNFARAVEPLAPYRTPITSHNLYLDIASETGIFGLAAWFGLNIGALWLLLKDAWKNNKSANPVGVLKIGLAGSLIYFFVHSIFETAMFNPVVLAGLMIIFGLASPIIIRTKIYSKNESLA